MDNMLTKDEIAKIQAFCIGTLKDSSTSDQPISRLAKDNCSEISRLTGCYALQAYAEITVHILKGVGVLNRAQDHEIVAIQSKDKIYIFDPSIWQFFPRKRKCLLGVVRYIQRALIKAEEMYGGSWSVSEKLTLLSCAQNSDGWKSVLQRNNG